MYYLHTQGDGTAFIHGDVKSANILLDGPRAKLADFGLVREMDAKKTHVGTRSLSGSWGYICPHYARTGQCSPATDLYAFGVVLLEALTGAGAISAAREPKDLVSWCEEGAWARRDARIRIADGTGRGVAGVASDCLNANARARPPTEAVHDAIEELELAQSRETFRGRPASGRSLFGDGPRPRSESDAAFAVVIGSFNMNGVGLDVATLAAWLRHGTVVDGRGRRRAADLVVVGLQEAAKGRAFSNACGFLETHLERHVYAADASVGHARMGMRLLVYARSGVVLDGVVKDAFCAGGLFKGALTASFVASDPLRGTFSERLSFTNLHLPAHEGRRSKRTDAFARIRNHLEAEMPGDAAASFVFGDLNYRSNPALDLAVDASSPAAVQRMVDAGAFGPLARVDELSREIDAGGPFAGFVTPPPAFPPTFKVARDVAGYSYQVARLPSYTDRILWSAAGVDVRCGEYAAAADVKTSDHKPIRGTFALRPSPGLPSSVPRGRDRHSVDLRALNLNLASRRDRRSASPPRRLASPTPPPSRNPPSAPSDFLVRVPASARPGSRLRVSRPDGRLVDVVVPEGLGPDREIRVRQPA